MKITETKFLNPRLNYPPQALGPRNIPTAPLSKIALPHLGSLAALLFSGLLYTVEGQTAPRLTSQQGGYSAAEVTSIVGLCLPILAPVFISFGRIIGDILRER